MTRTVAEATAPVTRTVAEATAPVTRTVAEATAPVTRTVATATAPVTRTVAAAIEPVIGVVTTATEPVTRTVDNRVAASDGAAPPAAAPQQNFVADTGSEQGAPPSETPAPATVTRGTRPSVDQDGPRAATGRGSGNTPAAGYDHGVQAGGQGAAVALGTTAGQGPVPAGPAPVSGPVDATPLSGTLAAPATHDPVSAATAGRKAAGLRDDLRRRAFPLASGVTRSPLQRWVQGAHRRAATSDSASSSSAPAPVPSAPAAASGGGAGAGTAPPPAAHALLVVTLIAVATILSSLIVLPARLRPVPFISLSERPG